MATLFFSYAHADEAYRDRLEMSLAMLRREGLIEGWHDRCIVPGAHIDRVISEHLERADIVLLLVSPDFLASEYCYEVEMTRAPERQEAGECIVIPVIVRPCDWHGAPFGRLNALPTDGKPITKWSDLDEAFLDVTKGIRKALGSGRPRGSRPPSSTAQAARAPEIRSANLRVSRVFSEQDREDFLRGAFEYIERYFENSLAELARRHADMEGRFRRIDANRFTSVAYRAGRPLSRCTVWFGGPGGLGRTIDYLANDSGDTSSFNEALSANADEQSLFLELMGMSSMSEDPDGEASSRWRAARNCSGASSWNRFSDRDSPSAPRRRASPDFQFASERRRAGTAAARPLVPRWFQFTPVHRHPSTGRPDTDPRSHATMHRHACRWLGPGPDS